MAMGTERDPADEGERWMPQPMAVRRVAAEAGGWERAWQEPWAGNLLAWIRSLTARANGRWTTGSVARCAAGVARLAGSIGRASELTRSEEIEVINIGLLRRTMALSN